MTPPSRPPPRCARRHARGTGFRIAAALGLGLAGARLALGCTSSCPSFERCDSFDILAWCAEGGDCTGSGGGARLADRQFPPAAPGDGTRPYVLEVRLAKLKEEMGWQPVLEIATKGWGPSDEATLVVEVDGAPAACRQSQLRSYDGEAKWECPAPRDARLLAITAPVAYHLEAISVRLLQRDGCSHPRICEE